METFKIFVSRSFDSRDGEVTSAVLTFCRAVGFEPVRTERASASLPREKIRDGIAEAQVFLGLITADHDRDGTETKHWLITEIGMAEYANLPMVLFIEEGVAFEPGNHLTSYARFSRDDIPDLCRKVVSTLTELREDSRELWASQAPAKDHPYKFLDDDVELFLDATGVLTHIRHLTVQSQISALDALQPITRIITSSRALGYWDSEVVLTADVDMRGVTLDLRRNDPSEVSYQVGFVAPLAKGESTSFSVRHTSRGSLPLTREDLEVVKESVLGPRRSVARQGHAVRTPTDRLTVSMRFPDSYLIAQCNPQVHVTLRDRVGASAALEEEEERVRQTFKVRHNRLEVEVDYPKVDFAYYFEWQPPPEARLPDEMCGTVRR